MESARLVSLYFRSPDQLHMPDYLPTELIINYTLQVKILQNASLDLIDFRPLSALRQPASYSVDVGGSLP